MENLSFSKPTMTHQHQQLNEVKAAIAAIQPEIVKTKEIVEKVIFNSIQHYCNQLLQSSLALVKKNIG